MESPHITKSIISRGSEMPERKGAMRPTMS